MGAIVELLALLAVPMAIASAQSADVPDWQTAAGGSMAFEVASVKPAASFAPPNFPLSNEGAYTPGKRLTATFTLPTYITFAYKLWLTPEQERAAISNLPKWVETDLFEIHAEAAASVTKDQMRLMMQSLLADRFQLKVHFETHETPVLALVLDKPGRPGPKLRPHSVGPACPEDNWANRPRTVTPTGSDVFPAMCGITAVRPLSPGLIGAGSRDTTMELLANMVQTTGSIAGEFREPVVDRTGLSGRFDYSVEYGGHFGPPPPASGAVPAAENSGPTFREALREQLGLKLVPSRAPIQTIVIDHVERPSAN